MTIRKYAGDKITGLSTDTKPTNVSDGATFYESDTKKVYLKVSGSWSEISVTTAASYIQNTDSRVLSGNLEFSGANVNFDNGFYIGQNTYTNTTALVVGSNSTNKITIATNTVTLPTNGFVQFGGSNSVPYAEGKLYYDGFDKTLTYMSDNSGFILPIGQKEFVRCYNNSGGQINKGQPVYITGVHVASHPYHSHHPTIALADASDATKSEVLGLAAWDIPNSSHGFIIVRGWVNYVNTASLTAASKCHLGFSAPGTIQTTAPEYPNYPMDLGWCLVSDASNGVIYVDVVDHTVERFRVLNNMHIGGTLSVEGDLAITGNVISSSVVNISAADSLMYLGTGDTIANTNFTGSGLNDGKLHGVFEGTSTTSYYVKIDTTGTPDKFTWSKDNFVTNVASNVAITGDYQTLDNGISIKFEATTGHTLGDVWYGTAAPINIDMGWAGNYNDGTYQHAGLFRDASDGFFKVFDSYLPEPSANVNIDTSNSSFHIANFWANTIYVGNTSIHSTVNTTNFTGTANNTIYVGSVAASDVVSNSQLSSNLSNYQTTAGLSANVATLTSNNTNFVGSVSAANVVSNSQLSSNLSNYAALSGASFTGNLVLSSTVGVSANGTYGSAGQALTTNGSAVYWSTIVGTNTAASYVWTNTHTFDATVSFSNTSFIISNSVNTSGTSQQTIDTFLTSSYRSVNYFVQITDNNTTNFHIENINLLHDGTNAYMSEFGAVYANGSPIATFDASIGSGTLSLKATPISSNTTIKLTRTTMAI